MIAEALGAGVPVLVAVNQSNLAGFLEFAQELAEPLPAETDRVAEWCLARIREAATA